MYYINNLLTEVIKLFIENPLYQVLGIMAFLTELYVVSVKDDKKMIIGDILASSFWIMHFGVIGALTASGNNFISIFRNLSSLKWKGNLKLAILFCVLYLVLLYFTYENIFSFLPIISSLGYTIGFFLFKGIGQRIFPLIGSCCWLIYGFYTNSIGGVLTETIMIATLLLTIFRLYKQKQSD